MPRKLSFTLVLLMLTTVGFGVGRSIDFSGREAAAGPSTELHPVVPDDIAALTDGVVTDDEYRSAFNRWVACVEDSGATVTGPVSRDRYGHFSVPMVGPSGATPEKAQELLRARTKCHASYLSPLELKWNEAHRPSEDDDIAAREHFASCLRESGIAIAEPPNRSAVQAAIEKAMATELGEPSPTIECVIKTQQELGLPGWGGS